MRIKNASIDHRRLLYTVAFSTVLLGMIALALGNENAGLSIVALASAVVLAVVFHIALPGSDFFSAVFANSIGIYACAFVFFVSQNFTESSHSIQALGFSLPLLGFLIGVLWRRGAITGALRSHSNATGLDLRRAPLWIVPLFGVGVATFALPLRELSPQDQNMWLVGAMTVIALTVLLTAKDIAGFLLDTVMLSEDFFSNAARLGKPAFAFFTCYSLLVLFFGCVYTILDRLSSTPNFLVNGSPRTISFGEGLYLSVVTLSTVGYGDLNAASALARTVVGMEIVTGVLLLLFGVQAILAEKQK